MKVVNASEVGSFLRFDGTSFFLYIPDDHSVEVSCWVDVYSKEGVEIKHDHNGEILSGVYIIKIAERHKDSADGFILRDITGTKGEMEVGKTKLTLQASQV
jgi:hypothetical protein